MPYIIGEVGSNFHDLNDCIKSIKIAKDCGADAVKFQMFGFATMYGFGSFKHNGIDHRWLPKLAETADRCKIDFMCTAFQPDDMAMVDQYVKHHKIASSDMCDWRMIEAAKKTGKKLFLSTGAKTLAEITQSAEMLGHDDVLMYCEASYPSNNINGLKYEFLSTHFLQDVGFSDHTTNIYPLIKCEYYEKHVNLVAARNTPDAPHSLNAFDFKRFVKAAHGDYEWVTPEDKPMVELHNKRCIAIQDLKPGDQLRLDRNYGFYRSRILNSSYINPMDWEKIEGKTLIKPISVGEAITLDHMEPYE